MNADPLINSPMVAQDVLYEVVNGQYVEKPPMGASAVWIASKIQSLLGAFADANQLGSVVTEMLFSIRPQPLLRRRPDVAFVSSSRWPFEQEVPDGPAWDVVPNLTIEVISPSDLMLDTMTRLDDYFQADVEQVWVVLPPLRQVYIYRAMNQVQILDQTGTLEGGALVPGFECSVAEIFPRKANPT